MTTLVTGATGLLGGHLVDLLVEAGDRPRTLVLPGDDASRLVGLNVEICRGDIADPTALEVALRGVDRVLHCAARTGPWGPLEDYMRTNVYGLQALVEASLKAGVGRIVHVSSITVHGNDVGGVADETFPIRVEPNPYSRSKVAGERLLERMIRERRAPITIVRPGWIYGPRDLASFARFAAMIEAGRMIVIGSGRNHIPLVHVRDVARGTLQASETPEALGQTYLLVNDEPVAQHDYLEAIAAELGIAPPRRRIPYRAALGMGAAIETTWRALRRQTPPPLMRYGVQLLGGENRFIVAKARSEIDFSPRVDLASGVRESIAWYRSPRMVTA